MIKEEKFLNNWVKITKYSSYQWKKFETYIFFELLYKISNKKGCILPSLYLLN